MVANSGTAVRADRLRPLNRPRPIRVEMDGRGYPVALGLRGRGKGVAVAEIMDRWRIDDEWWRPALQADATVGDAIGRAEVSRMYFQVALENRQLLVIFQDLIGEGWYAQTTASPLQQPEAIDVLAPRIAAKSAASAPEERVKKPAPIRRISAA